MKKILIANRGEIALRIMRSAKEMGIKTVAIYSEADRLTPHVKYADQAVYIGPSPSSKSYLLGKKIIDLCIKLRVDAIHPGYGFLSENYAFAQLAQENKIVFIGPPPNAIKIMGSKLAAKNAILNYNVPLVPGTSTAISSITKAKQKALDIGYPILIKASAGGGGKGMRIVKKPSDFEEQMKRAVSEAKSSFGDGAVFIEKYIVSPRHIEIQILADQHGNYRYLFERECSIQRRHQKVIEEAPSIALSEKLRQKMGQTAINVAKSCSYVGAGTVEFLMDENEDFYFLEMNTRLQVEHPVTEMITGIDIVKEQIRIAKGQTISFSQKEIKIRGHAIELRVCAEDPFNHFLPDIGVLQLYKKPEGPGIRVDDGFEQGMSIPIYYDAMISKLIAYGKDRNEAIERMKRAIDEYQIIGVKNTLSFGRFVMENPFFIRGEITTHFIENHFNPTKKCDLGSKKEAEIAAIVIKELLDIKEKSFYKKDDFSCQTRKNQWKANRY